MSWQMAKLYIPAPYNQPGMLQRVRSSVLDRLYGPAAVDSALDAGWLQEVSRHRDGLRRFTVQLTDNRTYHPIPVSFVLSYNGEPLC